MNDISNGTSNTAEAGFALPLTIFLVSIITLMLAASYARASSEHRTADAAAAEVTALAVAQGGLQAFFGDTLIVARPTSVDSFRYNVTGGYAWIKPDVVVEPLDTLVGSYTYAVRSTGYYIEPAQGSTPLATRTVAQYAAWQAGFLPPMGAFTAVGGITWATPLTPPTITIDGNDEASCAVIDSVGFRGPWTSDPPVGATGVPPWITAGSTTNVASATGIDWNAIVNLGAIVPDYPAPINGDNTFATYLIQSDYTINNLSGTGLLIAKETLQISGSFTWEGVIITGGNIVPIAPANINIHGMLITGMNDLTGWIIPSTTLNQQDVDFSMQYNSCNVRKALRHFRGFVPLKNARVDNWSTY
jgi:hypothetical protein